MNGLRSRALAALLAAALAGCGGVRAADLFVVTRTAAAGGSRLTLLVNEEGGVHCNGAAAPPLSDAQLVQAHAIQEDLHDAAGKRLRLPARPGFVYGYFVRDENGSVGFADNSSGQPTVLRRLQLFVLQVARSSCHVAQ